MTVNWTQVLIVGVPAYIAAIFAGVAMLMGNHNRNSLRVPSGGTIGEKVESAHGNGVANNLLLRAMNGVTHPAAPEEIAAAAAEPPSVPEATP